MIKYRIPKLIGPAIILTIMFPALIAAQGSIFGSVANSDQSVPANGEISFFGYLDDTDEEIRIESSVGAGFDAGNWYDDFQNYMTEGPGNPYRHHFFNITNGEGFILSKSIPDNSFQQEDIILAAGDWPPAVTGLTGRVNSPSEVEISWDYLPDRTWHVYRRNATSNGSFFRIDNPAGLLSDPGVADSLFIDADADSAGEYHYLVIAEDPSGNLGVHSEIIYVDVANGFMRGDANHDNSIDVADVVYIINFIFKGGPSPDPYEAGDANCDGSVDVADCVYIINYIFKGGPPPGCPE